MQVTLRINDREIKAEKGRYLLSLCRELGIDIPTMCQNDELTEGGHCRLCLVEMREGDWSKVVTSCLYPAKEGLNIYTDSEKIRATRKTLIELMLARAPHSPQVQALAERYLGHTETPYVSDDPSELCILCGQCVATCTEVVGVSAIGVSSRGIYKKVGTPFERPSDPCIGCGACAFVCPTDAVPMTDTDTTRTIWGREFDLQRCDKCHEAFMPKAQVEHFAEHYGVDRAFYDRCPNCR